MSISDNQIPTIPESVLRWLEALFPDRLPRHAPSIEEVNQRVGQQQVLDKLRAEYKAQTEPDEDEDE